MLSSPVGGYSAYTQFTARSNELAKIDLSELMHEQRQVEPDIESNDPIDTVSISDAARSAYAASIATHQASAHIEFREWVRVSGMMGGALSQQISSEKLTELLSVNGIDITEDESFVLDVNSWCSVSVSGRNAEKAKAIQDLLNSTPSGINWGFLLAKLPVD